MRTMNIQISFLQNQHSGKDTHLRQLKIFGPRELIKKTKFLKNELFKIIEK